MSKRTKYPNGSPVKRCLQVLKILLEQPEVYTKKSLAEMMGVEIDAISVYFEYMKEVGFDVRHNDYPDYQYYIHNADEIRKKIK